MLLLPHANASSLCDQYKEDAPELYKVVCTNGSAATKPAGANSTYSDAFNINSASLPTEPSSYGLEIIGSYLRNAPFKSKPTFSIIKGYHRFGTGVSTAGNSTFYGNDVIRRLYSTPLLTSFEPMEIELGNLTNLNLGSSISLLNKRSLPKVTLGISLRYNNTTDTLGGGPGLLINFKRFSIGGGYTREKVSNYFGIMTFTTFVLSTHYSIFEVEYSYLKNIGILGLNPIHILTMSTSIKRLYLSGAARQIWYQSTGTVLQFHGAIQYLYSKRFSIGILYNYIPGATSMGLQLFL